MNHLIFASVLLFTLEINVGMLLLIIAIVCVICMAVYGYRRMTHTILNAPTDYKQDDKEDSQAESAEPHEDDHEKIATSLSNILYAVDGMLKKGSDEHHQKKLTLLRDHILQSQALINQIINSHEETAPPISTPLPNANKSPDDYGTDEAATSESTEAIKITPLDDAMIEKATKYVNANIKRSDLSVEELSAHLGMSRVHLYKKMKVTLGKTPVEFIRHIRLERGAKLLRDSKLSVTEIAYQLGYNNPKYFSKYFKDEFGMLPSVYQNHAEK